MFNQIWAPLVACKFAAIPSVKLQIHSNNRRHAVHQGLSIGNFNIVYGTNGLFRYQLYSLDILAQSLLNN